MMNDSVSKTDIASGEMVISRADDVGLHQIRPDLRGTVIAGKNITLVRWVVGPGSDSTPLHAHGDHEQFTVVVQGSVETKVGEHLVVLSAGDVCRIEAGVVHGQTRVLGSVDAVLIDVFEPQRDDYLAAHG